MNPDTNPIPEVPDHLFQGKQSRARLDPANVCKVHFGGPGPPDPVTVNLTINLPTKEDCTPLQIGPDGRYIVPGVTGVTDQPGNQALLDRAYAMKFDISKPQPKEEILMSIGKAPIASNGNLTGVQGKSKVGKSSVVSAIIGAALRGNFSFHNALKPGQGDCLGFEWAAKKDSGTILHFDTEQSPADWFALALRACMRGAIPKNIPRLVSIPLVQFSRLERLEIVRLAMERESAGAGVGLVIIDGVADLCASPNDEAEALALIGGLHALCHEHDTAIVGILHENPGTDQGKTRGHLGSELNRKAFANLRVDKEDGVSIIYGEQMRKKDIPKGEGICFQWSDEAMMHVSAGTSKQLQAAKIEAKQEEKKGKSAEIAEEVFAIAASMGYAALVARIEEVEDVEKRTAERRVKAWKKAGIITQNGTGNYSLNP